MLIAVAYLALMIEGEVVFCFAVSTLKIFVK